jgi:6,7-dimethyl-8-ribityllumazine synthase
VSLTKIEGNLNAAGKKFAIIGARWNEIFSERLIQGAVDAIIRHGGSEEHITGVRVPGSFEVPFAAQMCAERGNVNAIVAVGTLIRGETDHYQLIAGELASGLSRVMAQTGIPVTFGVVTAENMEQAMARSGSKAGNKGWDAAVAAIEMANLVEKLRK